MHRTHSDPITQTRVQQHIPQRPSRLNPALAGRRGAAPPAALHGRGTVSMPTSPLRRAIELPWAEPHTAQAFFGYSGNGFDSSMDVDPFGSPYQPEPPSIHSTPQPHPQPDPFHLTSSAHDPSNGFGSISGVSANEQYREQDVEMSSAPHTPSGSEGRMVQPQWSHGMSQSPISARPSAEDDRAFPHGESIYGVGTGDEHDEGAEADMEDDQLRSAAGGQGQQQQQRRKKRVQVRVACTHCQKACKKCSNTRPCERCTKYNLPDCVDSTRKPRKTGVKRGPYRRRNSKGYALGSSPPPGGSYATTMNADSSSSPYSQHELELLRDLQDVHHMSSAAGLGNQGTGLAVPETGYHYQRRMSQKDAHELLYAQQQEQVHQLRQLALLEQQDQQLRQRQRSYFPQYPHERASEAPSPHPTWPRPQPRAASQNTYAFPPQPGSPTLPAPRPSRLEHALSAALSGLSAQPRWVDGQRVHEGPGTLMPHTPTVPFPLSLQRQGMGDDPFSRAVSPIKTFRFGSGAPQPEYEHASSPGRQGGEARAESVASPSAQAFGNPTNQLHYGTVVPSSNNSIWGGINNSVTRDNQPSHPGASNAPAPAASYPEAAEQQPSPDLWNINGHPTTIALKRIRKPSLRTLIVEGISREGSPVASPAPGPLSGSWSPGLAMMSERNAPGANAGMMRGLGGAGVRDGTMSPTLFQGDVEGVEELNWGFGNA